MIVERYVPVPRLKKFYQDVMVDRLKEILGISNIHEVPQVKKIVITSILGKKFRDNNLMAIVEKDLELIAAQKPVQVYAKTSVSSFSLRKGMKLGYKVTLRKNRMFEFLDRLLNIALPQTKSQILSEKALDGKGNISIGISDYSTVFPEMSYRSDPCGIGMTIVTSAKNNRECRALLEMYGVLFEDGTPESPVGQTLYVKQPDEVFEKSKAYTSGLGSVKKETIKFSTHSKDSSKHQKETLTKKKEK